MKTRIFALSVISLAALSACGGGGGSSTSSAAAVQTASVPVMVSDAASEDWSKIQVSVLALTLTDSSGAVTNVPLPSTPYVVNLAQLDNLGDVLNAAQLTAGATYTQATLTLSANSGDVVLKVSADPEAGFPVAGNTAIASSDIQIQGARGSSGSKTVTVPITLSPAFTVPASGAATAPVNLDFDLSHPAFIVAHVPAGASPVIRWAVNFNGPVKQKPIRDLTHLVLRHTYGSVTSVASDNLSLTLTRDVPTLPIVSPETAVATTQSLPIQVDASNGTLFYDVDARNPAVLIHDLSTVRQLLGAGEFVRVAARYQADGTLVATRIWASATFNGVFVSPEGHVLHVDSTNGTSFQVDNAEGSAMTIGVNAATQFFFRNPGSASDVTPIGTGTGFLQNAYIARGFKVRVTPVDVTASPIVAAAVDIESAPYEGKLSAVSAAGFSLSHSYNTASDNYTVPFSYISGSTANGKDPITGNAITGFKFWDFAYPSIVTSGGTAVNDFVAAVGGSVNFGNAVNVPGRALTYATWDTSALGWSAPLADLIPAVMPHTTVASPVSGNSFQVNALGGANAVTVNFSTTPGSATLVYQVDRTGDTVTVTPQDITTVAGKAALTNALTVNTRVVVSAVPQADQSLKAYVISYYTGTQSSL